MQRDYCHGTFSWCLSRKSIEKTLRNIFFGGRQALSILYLASIWYIAPGFWISTYVSKCNCGWYQATERARAATHLTISLWEEHYLWANKNPETTTLPNFFLHISRSLTNWKRRLSRVALIPKRDRNQSSTVKIRDFATELLMLLRSSLQRDGVFSLVGVFSGLLPMFVATNVDSAQPIQHIQGIYHINIYIYNLKRKLLIFYPFPSINHAKLSHH